MAPGFGCITSIRIARRPRAAADGERRDPAVPRRAVPACASGCPEAHEAPGQRREEPRAAAALARGLPRDRRAQHLHRRLPGETEAEFEYLLDFMRTARIDRAGCFAYSPVDGAAANELPACCPPRYAKSAARGSWRWPNKCRPRSCASASARRCRCWSIPHRRSAARAASAQLCRCAGDRRAGPSAAAREGIEDPQGRRIHPRAHRCGAGPRPGGAADLRG